MPSWMVVAKPMGQPMLLDNGRAPNLTAERKADYWQWKKSNEA